MQMHSALGISITNVPMSSKNQRRFYLSSNTSHSCKTDEKADQDTVTGTCCATGSWEWPCMQNGPTNWYIFEYRTRKGRNRAWRSARDVTYYVVES